MIEGKLTLDQIAEEVGVKPHHIRHIKTGWRGKPEFVELLKKMGECHYLEARLRVKRRSGAIVDSALKDMKSKKPFVRAAARRELREWAKDEAKHGDVNVQVINTTIEDNVRDLDPAWKDSEESGAPFSRN